MWLCHIHSVECACSLLLQYMTKDLTKLIAMSLTPFQRIVQSYYGCQFIYQCVIWLSHTCHHHHHHIGLFTLALRNKAIWQAAIVFSFQHCKAEYYFIISVFYLLIYSSIDFRLLVSNCFTFLPYSVLIIVHKTSVNKYFLVNINVYVSLVFLKNKYVFIVLCVVTMFHMIINGQGLIER